MFLVWLQSTTVRTSNMPQSDQFIGECIFEAKSFEENLEFICFLTIMVTLLRNLIVNYLKDALKSGTDWEITGAFMCCETIYFRENLFWLCKTVRLYNRTLEPLLLYEEIFWQTAFLSLFPSLQSVKHWCFNPKNKVRSLFLFLFFCGCSEAKIKMFLKAWAFITFCVLLDHPT